MSQFQIPDLSRKNKFLLATVLLVSILIPLLFWRSVWFGRPLTPEELGQQLTAPSSAREVQHALALIDQMIRSQDPDVKSYYPAITDLAQHEAEEIRTLAAWVMGQDATSSLFHTTLLEMLHDEHPMVRRNAALGLVRFGDQAALPELRSMLQPYLVHAPGEGVISLEVSRGSWVSPHTVVAVLQVPDGGDWEIRAQLPTRVWETRVEEGQSVEEGELLLELAPPPDHVWESLRALYLIGQGEDAALVEAFVEDQNYSPEVREQASLTARQIQARSQDQ